MLTRGRSTTTNDGMPEFADPSAYATLANQFPPHKTEIETDHYDVVIIGAGPGGLMASTVFARLGQGGHYSVLTVDSRDAPTVAGRADGLQPRTLEVFRNMPPIGEEMINRGSKSYERTFWNPNETGDSIVRTRRVQSCPSHWDTEEPYTLGVQQGLVEKAFLRDMDQHGFRVTRAYRFVDFTYDPTAKTHPVTVRLVNESTKLRKVIRTEYLLGADGGRSAVRHCMEASHNVTFDGDWIDTLWAAIDAVVDSDFPDIRKIAAIKSKDYGSVMTFPREHNNAGQPIVRLYTQINKSLKTPVKAQDVTVEDIMEADRKIFAPFKLDFKHIEWWTAYPIGQRLVSRYDVDQRIFIAGDACHTHSPKAGQGMNTSIIDAQNLAWKLHLVLSGLAKPEILSTYHSERHAIGKQLVDFDSEFAALFSGETPKYPQKAGTQKEMTIAEKEAYFIQFQRKNADFTSGLGVAYSQNMLNAIDVSHLGFERMTSKLFTGQRLEPGMVTRFSNSEPCKIIHEVKFDFPGGFRIYVLTGPHPLEGAVLRTFAQHLQSPQSFLNRFRGTAHSSSLENPYFPILTIVPKSRFSFEREEMKSLDPLNRLLYADDHQIGGVWQHDSDGERSVGGLHLKWGLNIDGGIVICRPDGYVGLVAPLSQPGWTGIERYFNHFLHSTNARL